MKNTTMHTGELHVIERLNNSVNGNPRYRVRIDGWTCVTKPDISDAYLLHGMPNGTIVKARLGTHYGITQVDRIAIIKD